MSWLRAAFGRFTSWFSQSDLAYILLLALCTMVIYFPILFDGQMISGDERVDGYYQYSIFFSQALESGESFLWNPRSYAGFPTFINQFGAFLFPPVYVAFTLLPPIFAFNVVIAIATFAGLAFAFLFGRSFFRSRPASLILAMSYCIAQLPNTFHLGLSYAHSFFVLPLLLLSLVGAKRATGKYSFVGYTALGCLAIAIGFLGGYFITFVYALVFAGFFALFLDVFSRDIGVRTGIQASISLAIMCVVGAVAGLPQTIPLFEYGPFTSRTAEFAHEMAVGSGLQLLDFIRIVLPYHFQFPLDPGKGYLYLGLIPLLMAIASLFYYRNRLVQFFGGMFLIFLGFALNAPIFGWINLNMPPFNHIGGVSRWLLVGVFALAFLAGYGFDRLSDLRENPLFLRFWNIVQPLLLIGVGLFVLLQFAIRSIVGSIELQNRIFERLLTLKGRTIESLRHAPDYYLESIRYELGSLYDTFSFRNADFTIFIVLTLSAIYLLHVYIRTGKPWSLHGLVAVSCATFLAGFVGGLGNTVSAAFFFSNPPAVAEVIGERGSDINDYRVISITGGKLARDMRAATVSPTPEDTTLIMRELLYREAGSSYGVRNISGFEPIRSMRANQLVDTALAPLSDTMVNMEALRDGGPIDKYVNSAILTYASDEEKAEEIVRRLPLISMMNGKYIVTSYPLQDRRLTEIPHQHAEGLLVDYRLYENKSALPKLYFATRPEIWSGSERDLFIEMLETPDFSKKTYIECADCEAGKSGGNVSIVHEENGVLIATTTSSTGGWLVYSESNLPGWIATIDGERVPIRTANYLFQGIEVPPGEHEIEFRYLGSFALFLEKIGFTRRQ